MAWSLPLSSQLLLPQRELPNTPGSVSTAARRALIDSPEWQAARPAWDLAMEQFDQLRVLRWKEPANSAAIVAAKIAFAGQLQLTAILLYRDPRNQQRWESVDDIRKHLLNLLDQSIGIQPSRAMVILSPRGKPLASHSGGAYRDEDLEKAFKKAVDALQLSYRRNKNKGKRRWIADIAEQLSVSVPTVKRDLATHPALREYLARARQ